MITEWMEPGPDRAEIAVVEHITDRGRGNPATTFDDPEDDLDAELPMELTELDLVGWFE